MYRAENSDFSRLKQQLGDIQSALGEAGLGGWLLFDLKARNEIAGQMLGHGMLSRRYFVLVPASGDPIAITHGIEQGPWDEWPWKREVYVAWPELDAALARTLQGVGRVAMEYSEGGAVPLVDLVPAGIVELVRAAGVEVVSSGDLIARFYSSWSPAQLQSHRTGSAVLAQVAQTTFRRLAQAIEAGTPTTEGQVRDWVIAALTTHGFGVGADTIAATGRNAADPHYSPMHGGATFRRGDVVLLDLWSKESEDSVYSDQTWMAYLGPTVPQRAAELFGIICAARDAAVEFLHTSWRAGQPIQGREVDDVCRAVVEQAGYGRYFIHRTGHSIDRSTHGMGPNIDNLETRDTRRIVPGVGFSIEPGIYIAGEIGVRTEINVYVGEGGPEVTTPDPQHEMTALLAH